MKNPELDRIVGGARKHARNQLRRERTTRYGLKAANRCVVELAEDEFMSIPAVCREKKVDQSQCRTIRQQIREFARDDRDVLLIEARWIKQLPLNWLAKKLGINHSAARAKIFRAKKYLRGE